MVQPNQSLYRRKIGYDDVRSHIVRRCVLKDGHLGWQVSKFDLEVLEEAL